MAKPKGSPKSGGRQKGTPNKATADVKALAGKHGPAAIAEAVRIMQNSDSDAARISAINTILDRAYGKASQPIGGADDLPAIRTALEVAFVGVRRE